MRSRVDTLLLAAATAVGIVVCFLLAVPFVGPLTGALALAILFALLHARIEARVRHPNLAAMLSVLALALMVAPPAAFVVERLVGEAAISASYIQKQVESGAIQRVIDAYPSVAPFGNWIKEWIDLPGIMIGVVT